MIPEMPDPDWRGPMYQNPAIPWYQSVVLIGQCVAVISMLALLAPHAAAWLHLASPDEVFSMVNGIFAGCGLIASVWALIARLRSRIQPITLTQAAADVHPATILAGKP